MTAILQDTTTRGAITLKGSAQLVAEFFYYGINSILYQRGIYPADSFERTKKYGTTILVTADEKLNAFLKPIVQQIEDWLREKSLTKLVVVIAGVQTKEVLERWQFDVINEDGECDNDGVSVSTKSEKKIRQEIADVIRQITASVTFLPLLETSCSFDVLLYTSSESGTPDGWGESTPCYVSNGREVQLRSFSTGLHAVDAKVTYKGDD